MVVEDISFLAMLRLRDKVTRPCQKVLAIFQGVQIDGIGVVRASR